MRVWYLSDHTTAMMTRPPIPVLSTKPRLSLLIILCRMIVVFVAFVFDATIIIIFWVVRVNQIDAQTSVIPSG